jgi:membrane-associated phospholipid phosphatase
VAYSRLYLGVQWWTDVAGGLALGGAWVCLLVGGVLVISSELPPRWAAVGTGEPSAPT